MECPQVGRGGVQANYQQLIPNLHLRIALCISCLIEGKKCFGKGIGWICALNKWSVQEQTGFCPVAGIAISGIRTVQADSCLISEQIDTLFISVGGKEGGLGGGGILGRRPKIYA